MRDNQRLVEFGKKVLEKFGGIGQRDRPIRSNWRIQIIHGVRHDHTTVKAQPWRGSEARWNNLDFLRFLFAVLVIFSHSYILLQGDNGREPVVILTRGQITGGYLAVAFFFILSGFLITQSWMNSHGVTGFIRKRVLRIFPGFVGAALFTILIIAPLGSPNPQNMLEGFSPIRFGINTLFLYLPATADVFVNNPVPYALNGSVWTIKYEFWCYLLVAGLGVSSILKHRRLMIGVFAGWWLLNALQLGGVVDLTALPSGGKLGLIFGDWGHYPSFITLFLSGAVFYLYRERIPYSRNLFLVCLGVLAILSAISFGLNLALPIFGAYAIFYVGFHPAIKMQTFAERGDLSYGVYLYAYPIQQLIVHYTRSHMNPVLLFLSAFALTFVLALASWHFIEKPFLKRKALRALPAPV